MATTVATATTKANLSMYDSDCVSSSISFDGVSSSNTSALTGDSTPLASLRNLSPIRSSSKRGFDQITPLTIDKLDYKNLGLIGRDEELQLLLKVLKHKERKQLVWIHGESGTGKTALVRRAVQNAPLVGTGKFDETSEDRIPYAAIGMACGEICSRILSLASARDPEERQLFREIQSQMEETVGPEGLGTLMNVIPALAEVIDTSSITGEATPTPTTTGASAEQQHESSSAESSKNRLNFAFKSWVKVVIQFFSSLVLVLDDLQWADVSSLSLLESLMSDRNAPPALIVIGIYRHNQVGDTHPLHHMKRSLVADACLDITNLAIGNLTLPAVHSIVHALLHPLDDEPAQTLGLAKLCLSKTNGNVFFLLQFMSMLHHSQLIKFNIGRLEWLWDSSQIVRQTEATDNVVTLLLAQMERLDVEKRRLLPLAASLGSTFSERVIGLIWKQLCNDDDDGEAWLVQSLASFQADGFVEGFGDHGTYRWAHDRIREAAGSLLAEQSRPSFHRQVGEIMLSELDETDRESSLFVIVGLLNQGTEPVERDKRLAQAHLNLQATRRAIGSSAFAPAARYAARGIELLQNDQSQGVSSDNNSWLWHYDLCLELYSLGAQAEGYLGNVEIMEKYCNEVLLQEDKPLQDKFRVYDVLVDSLANRGNLEDAVGILMDVLARFGCRLPARGSLSVMPKILWNMVKIKRKLNRNWFDDLQPMKDALRLELGRFLDRLITYFYLLEDDRMPLAVFQMLKWTIKYGYCEYSTIAIGFTGVIFISALNDLQSANICRELTLALMDKMELRVSKSRTILIVHGFLQHWAKPIRGSLNPLLNGYEVGLKSGDTESASWCIYHFCLLRFFSGAGLDTLEKDLRAYCMQTADLQRLTPSYLIAYVWQAVLNIQGRAKGDCLILDGDAVDADEYSLLMKDKKYKFVLSAYYLSLAMLYCYLGAHEKLANLTCEVGFDYIAKVFPGTLCPVIDVYVKGVSCYAAARESKNPKFARMGKRCLSQLRHWSKNGNVNVQHQLALVEAECAAYHGKNDKALGLYLTALRPAARSGFLHHAGLASERLCELYMSVLPDKEEAKFRYLEAKRYYSDWGATAKVKLLEERYHSDLGVASDIIWSGNSFISRLTAE